MKQLVPRLALATALAMLGTGAESGLADDAVGPAATPVAASDTPEAAFPGSLALDDAVLAEQRGGAATHLSELSAAGSVSEVAVTDAVTGHNLITDGALAGASGIPMFIQNSGNGVLIQNAVILNVDLQ